jgi:monofunctional biosynthetic peptidoglycan transglycosylase
MVKLLKLLLALFLLLAIAGVAYYSVYPDVARLKRVNPGKTAFMAYREREWKEKGKKVRIRRRWVGFSHISPYVAKAVVISEDDKFWSHRGFDLDALEKAVEEDLKAGRLKFGGSTISQQLVKNLYLSPSKNPFRKLTEALITRRLEKTLSKKRILELYLNVAEWGEGIFGVEAASLYYYGKPSALVTAEEAARLAAVLPNPRRYGVNDASGHVRKRAEAIYAIMVKRGVVVEYYEDASREAKQERPPADGSDKLDWPGTAGSP